VEPFERQIRDRARALGFDVVGIARAAELTVEHDRYRTFVAREMHGTMAYLAAHGEARRRVDGEAILPGARSVVCVGRRYARAPATEARDAPLARTIARYARGRDYHTHLRKRLRKLAAFVRDLGPDVRARPLCDVEPVLERAWAARSGLGFVGKNGLVITPGQGSYQLLGEVVTTLELVADTPMTERCGSCTRCLDACPTSAFDAPFVLDPRRCIAYWTIETTEVPPPALRDAMGEHLFGCDVCQEVCPFNRTEAADPSQTAPFAPHERWKDVSLARLVELDDSSFAAMTEASPLRRAHRGGLARSAVLVATARLGHGAAVDATTAAGTRQEPLSAADARRALEAARTHDDAGVRAVAAWAVGRLHDASVQRPPSARRQSDEGE
jgi:epoxyqueuosine reductase